MSRLIESAAAFTLIPLTSARNPDVPLEQRQPGMYIASKRIYIDAGIYFVTLEWDAPESATLSISRNNLSTTDWERILTLPGGEGARSVHRKLVVSDTSVLLPTTAEMSATSISANYSLGLSIIRIGE